MTGALIDHKNNPNILTGVNNVSSIGVGIDDKAAKGIIFAGAMLIPQLIRYPIALPESTLTSSVIHPVVGSLFKSDDLSFPHCSNVVPTTEFIDELTNSRPDYRLDIFVDGNSRYTNGFGEIKPSSSSSKTLGLYLDLYRIAIFCKLALSKNKVAAVMAFKTVGQ